MTHEDRVYQERALQDVQRHLRDDRSVCLVSPTGSGKSVMGARLIREALAGGTDVMCVAPRREIVLGIKEELGKLGITARLIDGPHARREPRVHVCSIQSLFVMKQRPLAGLLLLDEAHRFLAPEWRRVAEYYPGADIVGLTATPQRADGTALGDMFSRMVVAATYSELIASGELVPCELWRPQWQLGSDLALSPLQAMRQHALGSTIVFARGKQHVQALEREFNAAGVTAFGITEATPKSARDRAFADYKAGRIQALINYTVLTEGVNLRNTRTVMLCRGFAHVSNYIQAAGRGARPYAGKDHYRVLDLTGASHRFDFPDADREYSLDGPGIFDTPESKKPVHSAAIGEPLGLPLFKAKRPASRKTTGADREHRWNELVAEVATGGITRLSARMTFQAEFGIWAPFFE